MWVQKVLRACGAYIGLGDEGRADIDIRRYGLASRSSKRGLDAVITHAKWVFHDKPRDRVVLQELDGPFVRADADDIDLVARFALGDGLTHGLRRNQVGSEHAAQVGSVGDYVRHH